MTYEEVWEELYNKIEKGCKELNDLAYSRSSEDIEFSRLLNKRNGLTIAKHWMDDLQNCID